MHSECEAVQSDFECGPVEQLEMEVDDIVINDSDGSDMKSNDNDLCPIANDPYKSAESKHFDKGIRRIQPFIRISLKQTNWNNLFSFGFFEQRAMLIIYSVEWSNQCR